LYCSLQCMRFDHHHVGAATNSRTPPLADSLLDASYHLLQHISCGLDTFAVYLQSTTTTTTHAMGNLNSSVNTESQIRDMIMCRKQHTIFIGNPGVGKSALLNALVGRKAFCSGINAGTGLTRVLQSEEEPPGSNIFYVDTPGLEDMCTQEKAAKEIAAALRLDGIYKLVFVVTEESLRVRPQDITTINLVLDVIKLENGEMDVPYGIIVNKITGKRLAKLNDNEQMKSFQDSLNQKHSTHDFHFYLHNNALKDEDDMLHTATNELIEFLEDLDSLDIKPTQVADITTTTFDQVTTDVENWIKNLAMELKERQGRRAEAVRTNRYTQRDVSFQIKRELRPKDMVEDRLRLSRWVEHVLETTLEKVFGPPDEGKPLTLFITIKIVSNGAGILNQVIKLVTGRRWSYPMLEIDYMLKSELGALIDGRIFNIHRVSGVNDDIVMRMAEGMTSELVNDVCVKLKWFE